MRTKKDRANTLGKVSLFRGLSNKQLMQAAAHVNWSSRPEGTVLIEEGGSANQMFVLVEGTAKVSRKGRKLAELGPGDVIGEVSIVDPGPASATVTCTSDVSFLVMTSAEFRWLADNEPGFARNVLKQVAQRLRETDRQWLG
jgi:CRP/FNR family transcriptional regulator, cyclic AMP receptor protein